MCDSQEKVVMFKGAGQLCKSWSKEVAGGKKVVALNRYRLQSPQEIN